MIIEIKQAKQKSDLTTLQEVTGILEGTISGTVIVIKQNDSDINEACMIGKCKRSTMIAGLAGVVSELPIQDQKEIVSRLAEITIGKYLKDDKLKEDKCGTDCGHALHKK